MSMSVRCDGCGSSTRAPGHRRGVRPAGQRHQPALPAHARRGEALPPAACRLLAGPNPGRRARDARRLPRRRALLAVLRRPLHGAAGLVRVVVRAPAPRCLSGPLAVHVPRAPRRAAVSGSPAVAHGRRRLAQLRRSAPPKELTATELSTPVRSVAPAARPASRSATTPTTCAPSTLSSSPPTPTRRSCSSRIPPCAGRRVGCVGVSDDHPPHGCGVEDRLVGGHAERAQRAHAPRWDRRATRAPGRRGSRSPPRRSRAPRRRRRAPTRPAHSGGAPPAPAWRARWR